MASQSTLRGTFSVMEGHTAEQMDCVDGLFRSFSEVLSQSYAKSLRRKPHLLHITVLIEVGLGRKL